MIRRGFGTQWWRKGACKWRLKVHPPILTHNASFTISTWFGLPRQVFHVFKFNLIFTLIITLTFGVGANWTLNIIHYG